MADATAFEASAELGNLLAQLGEPIIDFGVFGCRDCSGEFYQLFVFFVAEDWAWVLPVFDARVFLSFETFCKFD